jgi:hypothetical protein
MVESKHGVVQLIAEITGHGRAVFGGNTANPI